MAVTGGGTKVAESMALIVTAFTKIPVVSKRAQGLPGTSMALLSEDVISDIIR